MVLLLCYFNNILPLNWLQIPSCLQLRTFFSTRIDKLHDAGKHTFQQNLTLLMLQADSGFRSQYHVCWCPGAQVAIASPGMVLAVKVKQYALLFPSKCCVLGSNQIQNTIKNVNTSIIFKTIQHKAPYRMHFWSVACFDQSVLFVLRSRGQRDGKCTLRKCMYFPFMSIIV